MENLLFLGVPILKHIRVSLSISYTDFPKYPLSSKEICGSHFLFFFSFNLGYLKLLVPQTKFSATRKFTLRYQ